MHPATLHPEIDGNLILDNTQTRQVFELPDKRLLPLLNEHGKLNPEIAQLVEQRREQRRGRER